MIWNKLETLVEALRIRLPQLAIQTSGTIIRIPSPNVELHEIRIDSQADQIVIELGKLFHTHIYGGEPEEDPTSDSSRQKQIEEAVSFIDDFIHERIVLWVTQAGGGAGICPVNAPVEYDEDEGYWPHGRPEDRRMLWSRCLTETEASE